MAKSRRKARESALVALYQLDLMRARQNPAKVVEEVCEGMSLSPDQTLYATELVSGIARELAHIDQELSERLEGYEMDRVASIDRAILRIGAYEILFVPSLAPAITVNEAVEIVKKYSTRESGDFVNGVLRRLVRESPKANWDPSLAPPEETEEPPAPQEPEPTEEHLDPELEETQQLIRAGWKIRSDL